MLSLKCSVSDDKGAAGQCKMEGVGCWGNIRIADEPEVPRSAVASTRRANDDILRYMRPSAHPEVILATPEQEPILANLLELYAHDFSEFHSLELGADGRFGYRDLPLYWREPGRHPFLVRMDGELAGFVLVKRGSGISSREPVWDMAEFFVVRGYRRRGIGTEIAHDVWRQFPGFWEVRVMQSNRLAHQFWERAISTYKGEAMHSVRIENGGRFWDLFSFESTRAA
jgi:predicted acetyltransferase